MWWFFQWVATLLFAYFYSQIRWCIYYVCWHFARIKCRFSYVKKQVGKKKMSIGSSSSAKTILIFLGQYFFEPSPIRFPCHLWRRNEIDSIDLAEESVIVLPKVLFFECFRKQYRHILQEKSQKLSVIFAVSKKKISLYSISVSSMTQKSNRWR